MLCSAQSPSTVEFFQLLVYPEKKNPLFLATCTCYLWTVARLDLNYQLIFNRATNKTSTC